MLHALILPFSHKRQTLPHHHNTSKISLVMGLIPLTGGDLGSLSAGLDGLPALPIVVVAASNASRIGLVVNSTARGDMSASG